jgi:hypothetical protein
MRRSALAVVLTVLALLATLGGSPGAAAPSALRPAGIDYAGDDTGNFYVAPEEFFKGEKVKLTANFPNEAALADVAFFRETSPGSGDYEEFDSDQANASGNAYITAYQVDEKQKVFASAGDAGVTELHTLEPETVEPGSCTQAGNLYASPSFITPGQEVKLSANFLSDQAGTNVTFLKKVGTDTESIGSDVANSSGNAYLNGYQVDDEQQIFALTTKGTCTGTETLKPTVVDPANFAETGTLKTDPVTIREGRTATIVANFPSGTFNVTAFQLKDGVWEAIGSDESNTSGNAYITGHKFDGTETIFAATDDGKRTSVRAIETIPPNVVSGGPDELGKNVVYVTTDSGATPKTKGVNYKGKAVLGTGADVTETLDVDEFAVRGNSSADKAKKPYKIKFEDKQSPFGMPSDKTWILLANYNDWTLVRSMVAWDLGKMLDGLKWTPTSTFAELFVNGKYVGSYQMVQSIKIDKNRVNVSKTTGQVIEFDPHWKEDGVPGMVGKTGVNYAWKDPDEFKDGGADPEGLTNAKIDAMKQRIRNFETVLYGASGGRDWHSYDPPTPADDWTTYLDMNSAVDYYLAREFTKDNDADMYRSNFFYTNNVDPSSTDKFFMGPIWDFDRSAGAKDEPSSTTVSEPTGWWMRGNGSPNHDTNKIHWYTRITDDPRFLNALHDRWAAMKQHFQPVGPTGVSAAVRKLGGDAGGINEPDVPADPDYDLGKQVAANDRAVWGRYGGRYHAKSSTYPGELAFLRSWYADRYEWMNKELMKEPPPLP